MEPSKHSDQPGFRKILSKRFRKDQLLLKDHSFSSLAIRTVHVYVHVPVRTYSSTYQYPGTVHKSVLYYVKLECMTNNARGRKRTTDSRVPQYVPEYFDMNSKFYMHVLYFFTLASIPMMMEQTVLPAEAEACLFQWETTQQSPRAVVIT